MSSTSAWSFEEGCRQPVLGAMRAIFMFHLINREGQSHKTVSTNHNLSDEKGEPKRNRTEVLLSSLTPYR